MISSRHNERIKTIRGLRKSKDEFAFLEGPRLIAELAGSDVELVEVLATEDYLAGPAGPAITALLGRRPLAVTASVLGSVAESATPQGVLAVARLPRTGIEGLPSKADGVYLFLDRMQDPGNLGAVVRSAEATGAAGVALAPGCAHPNHPRALRASGGSLLRMPVGCGAGIEALLGHLAGLGPRLVALVPSGGSDLYETELDGALVLALGSEGPGLESGARRARRPEAHDSARTAGGIAQRHGRGQRRVARVGAPPAALSKSNLKGNQMPRVLVFAGSSRRASFNRRLAVAAAEICREQGAETTLIELADYPLPLYSQDLEGEDGLPANATELKNLFLAHNALMIACPEYNGSITPLLKNTIDWVSRRAGDEPSLAAYRGKTALLLSASPGALGGLRGLVHVRAILSGIGVLVLPAQIAVPRAFEAFTESGSLADDALAARAHRAIAELVRVAGRLEA